MNAEHLAKIDRCVRNGLVRFLPPSTAAGLYSRGRLNFLKKFSSGAARSFTPPKQLGRVLWGKEFRSPLFNAAGMFKNGEGYDVVAAEGAGAYLAGTTTANPRTGNEKNGVRLAFSPYPRSKSASNWLGLPNDGDEVIAERIAKIRKVPGCPVGVSSMGSPDFQGEEKLQRLVQGLALYQKAGADFLEVNESCPNTVHGRPQDDQLKERLSFLQNKFLKMRSAAEPLPVIVKFSPDTPVEQVPDLIQMLIELGFDGVNFGNTSTNYDKHRMSIHPSERKLFDYFVQTFGGGVSGSPLKKDALKLVQAAAAYLRSKPAGREFHVIRTGGVETAEDLHESLQAGASLVEWYTGYFENFSAYGYDSYRRVLEGYLSAFAGAAVPV